MVEFIRVYFIQCLWILLAGCLLGGLASFIDWFRMKRREIVIGKRLDGIPIKVNIGDPYFLYGVHLGACAGWKAATGQDKDYNDIVAEYIKVTGLDSLDF